MEAIKKVPDSHYHLGLAYQMVDDKIKARTHLERVLELSPAV